MDIRQNVALYEARAEAERGTLSPGDTSKTENINNSQLGSGSFSATNFFFLDALC